MSARSRIVRKSFDFDVELDARFKVAARIRACTESKLLREIVKDYLDRHMSTMPNFRPPRGLAGV